MSLIDAMFGRIFSKGVSLDLEGGLNFTSGLKAVRNTEAQRIDVSLDTTVVVTNEALFTEGGTVTKAGNWAAETEIGIAAAGDLTWVVPLDELGDGDYQLLVRALSGLQADGTRYRKTYAFEAERVGDVLFVLDTPPTVGRADAEVSLTFGNDAGDLSVYFVNGAASTVNITLSVSLVFTPFNVVP